MRNSMDIMSRNLRKTVVISVFLTLAASFTCNAFVGAPMTACQRTISTSPHRTTRRSDLSYGRSWRRVPSNASSDRLAPSMKAPDAGGSAVLPPLATGGACIATAVGFAAPARADSLAQSVAQGIGAIAGPGLLAVPIVLGFLVATAVAVFIYSFSQPREYDE